MSRDTHHIADVGTFDQKTTGEVFLLFAKLDAPAIEDALFMCDLFLEATQIGHVLEMQAHVGGEDVVDHELTHGNVGKDSWPVAAQDLRICSAVERLEDGAVVVELSEGSVESDQEGIVDTWVTDVVPNCRDEEGKSVKRF